jgi:hypothetical protein
MLVAGMFGACKKDDSADPVHTSGGSATLTANLYGFDGGTGAKYTSSKAGITQAIVQGDTTFTISAIKDGSNECITIVALHGITSTGKITFVYNDSSNGGITFSKDHTKPMVDSLNYKTSGYSANTKGGGELNITKIDGKKVEGTFYFIAVNNKGQEAWAENGSFSGTIN